jgi:hypothetical protein
MNARQSSVSGIFEVNIDPPSKLLEKDAARLIFAGTAAQANHQCTYL